MIPYDANEASASAVNPLSGSCTWEESEISKERYGKVDPIAVHEGAGGGDRSTQQNRESPGYGVCGIGSKRDQEERYVRAAGHRPAGACGSQGSHGTQPGDRRSNQDSGQESREIPRCQGCEGRDRPKKKVAAG